MILLKEDFDVIDKIYKLCEKKGYSLYRLAKEAHLSQSTVRNMSTKHTVPSIYTLSMICNALGITLSDFFRGAEDISDDEMLFLSCYRKLSPERRKMVTEFLAFLEERDLENGKRKQYTVH